MTLKQLEEQYKGITLENSGEFISAINSAAASNDITSLSLIAFMNKIIREFIPEGKRLCDMVDSLSEQEEARIIIHGKIMAAQMHILQGTRSYKDLSETMLLFLEFAAFLSNSQHNLAAVAVRCLSKGCTSLGFSWENARSALSLDLIAYQIASKAEFNGPELEPLSFNGKGYVTIKDGKLRIASSYVGENGVLAYNLCDGAVEILTRNTRDERLKVSEQNDAVRLASFADYFIETQAESGRSAGQNTKAALKVGDAVTLKITGFSEDDEGYPVIKAMPLDTQDSPIGNIASEELIKGAFTEDLIPYIFDGDCFLGAKVVELGENLKFSIKDSYYKFAKKLANEDFRNNIFFEAKAVDVREDIGRINWMTARGYMGISLMIEGIKVGDIAVLTVQNIQTRNADMYINVIPPRYGYDEVHYRFEDESVLASYVMDTATALSDIRAKENLRKSEDEPKREVIRTLSRIFLNSLSGRSSLDKYKRILAASFLANSVSDSEDFNTARHHGGYLGRLLAFAQGDTVKRLPDGEGWSKEQNDTILSLSQFSSPDNIQELSTIVHEGDTANTVAIKVASLILALGISDVFEDEVKANRDEIRRKICELTGVSDHFRLLDEVVLGKYGTGEGHHLEFKSSYVMRNDGKGPDLDYQGRGQVFEAVCGFLNSDGGTLYLGVNDKTGDPIISDEYGLNGDMKWFADNFSTVSSIKSRQLGHFIVKPDNLDHYVLFLNSEKELYFKKSIADMIIIEPTPDEDAIKFTVPACRYEIAYLYDDETHTTGQAFTRDGNRTIPMSRVAMERRLMEQKQLSKEVGFIVTLQQACDQKRKVILRGYHSGNSGEVRDRLVVPINLFYNDENVLCYDLESHSEKQFRLARITSIDTDVPNPEYPHDFRPKQADVFRWIGDKDYHIKLRMEVGARNYLLEEYSNAKNLPAEEFYPIEDGKWILDTYLHGLGAVRRFYLGLADKIEILDTEDSDKLKEEIRKYKEEFLSD